MRHNIKQKQNSEKARYRSILLFFAAVALLIGVGVVSAKYIAQKQDEDMLRAKIFYFTSNLLREGGAHYVLNAKATEIPLTLGNNLDEIRCAEDNISYTITVEGGATINGATTVTGALTGKTVSVETLTLKNLEVGKTYTVTATGTAGYEKTISATFKVSDNQENVYMHLADHGEYYLFTVWTDNVSGTDMKISFPDGLVPDNTDPVMAGIKNFKDSKYTAQQFTDNTSFVTTYSSHQYRFFKESSAVSVTVNQFEVMLNSVFKAMPDIP